MINQPLRTCSLDNVDIKGDAHWWGFVLHLNEDATQFLEELERDMFLAWQIIVNMGRTVRASAGNSGD